MLNHYEISLFVLGASFPAVPKPDVPGFERDLYEFVRKLRLTYHFRNHTDTDASLVKRKSSFCPNRNQNDELERICYSIEASNITVRKTKDNISGMRSALASLSHKVSNCQLVIKPADKGSIIVLMSPMSYWDMCLRHLNNSDYYCRVDTDPSNLIYDRIVSFTEKYKDRLTEKETDFLINEPCKMANFYMLPKLHKSKEINNAIEREHNEYIHIPEGVMDLEGRPINSGPCYFTRGISLMIHAILLPCLETVKYILRDSFDFQDKMRTVPFHDETRFVTWDIKSLYTSIRHELFYQAVEYWIDKLQNKIPLLRRFKKDFVMEALTIILEFNYFIINCIFWHQLKGTAMGTPAAVVGANLVVAFLEIKMFQIMPQLYPKDFVDFIIRSYFRFLDDIIHQWLDHFDIHELYELINSLDSDITFEMNEIATSADFLDITIKTEEDRLLFNVYHKPTNAFNYLKFTSCHPKHTKENIALSLGRRIVKICTENRSSQLADLRTHLIKCEHPDAVIDDAFEKIMSPMEKAKNQDCIVFTRTFNPTQSPNFNKIHSCLSTLRNTEVVKAFGKKSTLCTTRQAKKLKQLLVKSKFQLTPPIPTEPRLIGLYPCGKCKFCDLGYIQYATEFTLNHRNFPLKWIYTRYFSCDSVNILYVVCCIASGCRDIYIGKAKSVKGRVSKHASDVRLPHNSKCKKCTNHLREHSKLKEPYFRYYPFFYVNEPGLRHFMETRFRLRWKPTLNSY